MDTSEQTTDSAVLCAMAPAIAYDNQLVRLADGATVRLRAAFQDDEGFRRLFFTLSDTTRYLYFLAGVPANATWAERFVALGHADDFRSFVLVAEVEGDLVGFTCFRQAPHANPHDNTADLGILLTDAWQGRGLGGRLLTRLAWEALQRGVTTLTATVLGENRRMLRLVRRIFPDAHTTWASGSCELTIDLESWRAVQDEKLCG